jgi:cyclophilin family peptidyl-prolyl cis-trans isomerase
LSRQRRRRRRGAPADYAGQRKNKLPFPLNIIFNVKAFYAFFIVVMIASMAAVGLGVGGAADPEPPELIDQTAAPSVTPVDLTFDSEPPKIINASDGYEATLTTSEGDIVIELATDAQQAVNNFYFLATKNFYDGTALYYVDHNYVAQGGDPNCKPDAETICTGFGDPGYSLPLEETEGRHVQWAVAAPAVSEADTVHGSQFRIYFQPDERLDGQETVFGNVVEGQEILEELPNLQVCSALNQPVEGCAEDLTGALIIEDVTVELAS